MHSPHSLYLAPSACQRRATVEVCIISLTAKTAFYGRTVTVLLRTAQILSSLVHPYDLVLCWLSHIHAFLLLAVSLQVRVRPLHWAQFPMALGIFNDCSVAEVILVPGLDAESPLCSHPPHSLANIYCANVLQSGEADVQCTECA